MRSGASSTATRSTGRNSFVAYGKELAREPAASAARDLLAHRKRGPVTLLYAARDEEHNNAVVLKAWLETQA
jgi:uncharacterized protein YeaO (DUF488 family)